MTLALPRATDPTQARHNQALVAEDLRNRKIGSDVELGAERIILRSPNGTRFQLVVSDDGTIFAGPAVPSGAGSPALPVKIGIDAFSATPNYSGSTTQTRMLATLGTGAAPDTTQDAVAIFQKVGNNASTSGKNPTVYISAKKKASGANQGETGLFVEAVDAAGGAGSFTAAHRSHVLLSAGTAGNGTAIIGLAASSIAYSYLLGAECQIFNNFADATPSFSSSSFEAAYTASNFGTKASFAGYIVNPFCVTPFVNGYYVAAGGASDAAFRNDASLVNGIDLSRGSYSGAAIVAPGFAVSPVGSVYACSTTAIAAGGTFNKGFKFSSTVQFGIFFGSGLPTIAAAEGSLYLRSDGSSTSTRLYVNTDGSTGWTNVVTAT